MSVVQSKAPTLLRVLTAATVMPKKQEDMLGRPEATGTFSDHFSKPVPSGSGNN